MVARAYRPTVRLALGFSDQGDGDLWIWDLARETLRRLTLVLLTRVCRSGHPTAGGSSSRRIARAWSNMYTQAADGTGTVDRLTTTANPQYPSSITPDGTLVVGFHAVSNTSRVLLFSGPGSARPGSSANATLSRVDRPPGLCSRESGRTLARRPLPRIPIDMNLGGGRSTCGHSLRWTTAAGNLDGGRDSPRVGAERSRAVLPRCIEYAHCRADPDVRIGVQRGQAGEGLRRHVRVRLSAALLRRVAGRPAVPDAQGQLGRPAKM